MVRHSPIRRRSPRKIVFIEEPFTDAESAPQPVSTPLKVIDTSSSTLSSSSSLSREVEQSSSNVHKIPFYLDDIVDNDDLNHTTIVPYQVLAASSVLFLGLLFLFFYFFM